MRTMSPPPPATDDLYVPRFVLRDGTTASVRVAGPADHEAMRQFFHDLSPESRFKRFFTAGEPSDTLIDRFCAAPGDGETFTIVALRHVGDEVHIVAAAS